MTTLRSAAAARWAPAIATLFALAMLCALAVYWAMQLLAPQVTIAPSGSLVKLDGALDTSASRQLFGNASGKPTVVRKSSVNVQVLGVAASDYRAAAVLVIDGQPARAYGVGEEIDEDFVVESVSNKEVVLNRDGETIRVEVPSSEADVAILTAGAQNDSTTSAIQAPTSGTATKRGGPNSRTTNPRRSRVQQAVRRAGGAARPALAPRRLPPSGAAAASAAAKNTTGVARPNTPAAGRRPGVGRPGNPTQNRSVSMGSGVIQRGSNPTPQSNTPGQNPSSQPPTQVGNADGTGPAPAQ